MYKHIVRVWLCVALPSCREDLNMARAGLIRSRVSACPTRSVPGDGTTGGWREKRGRQGGSVIQEVKNALKKLPPIWIANAVTGGVRKTFSLFLLLFLSFSFSSFDQLSFSYSNYTTATDTLLLLAGSCFKVQNTHIYIQYTDTKQWRYTSRTSGSGCTFAQTSIYNSKNKQINKSINKTHILQIKYYISILIYA